ncbi:MAG: histidinol dehydrogenase [Bacteroidota bacterium]
MKIIKFPKREDWRSILERPSFDLEELMASVGDIIKEVRQNGDRALRSLTEKFDKIKIHEIAVSSVEIADAKYEVEDNLKSALDIARANIELFHEKQMPQKISCDTTPGVKVWQQVRPIEKVGLYIPGGTAPLLSTVLMLGIPAKIAGCSEIIICTPPNKKSKVNPAILYTASLLGINKIYKVGGAQAVAAMAYGTETIPRVYKIFGSGNQYVTAAKMKVSLDKTAIDMPAGPSELAIIADKSSNPGYVASDLLSQAEHGEDSQVLLVTKDEEIIDKIQKEIDKQIKDLPRKEMARKALENSKFILMENDNEILNLINEYAPEHLIIVTKNYMEMVEGINNAGSVFLGHYTPESAGDYASGTNHTLPTNGAAKAFSGVNLTSFMKKITYQEITKYGLFNIGPSVERMARAEDLEAHRRAIAIRMNTANNYRS